jgi:hypothetical protein
MKISRRHRVRREPWLRRTLRAFDGTLPFTSANPPPMIFEPNLQTIAVWRPLPYVVVESPPRR